MNTSHSYVQGLDKETISLNFRLDIGITKFKDIDEFVSLTKDRKGRGSKIPIHSVRKNEKK